MTVESGGKAVSVAFQYRRVNAVNGPARVTVALPSAEVSSSTGRFGWVACSGEATVALPSTYVGASIDTDEGSGSNATASMKFVPERLLSMSVTVRLTLLTVWKNLGFNAILYLTALQALPISLTEAAQLDGASLWQRIRWITVPLLRPMTFFVVIQALITAFQSFDLVYVLTGGGPTGGTEVLGMLMYRYAFKLGEFGYGAAIAFATLALMLGVTLVQWKATGSGESDLA